ncbi:MULTISPECIES: ANTAR domain-containing protein [unclassified Rhodococcus (in: high G+C Gram-positive bacteria)]|uniref:ANTAR domain-containing protein n=1 Tax=unclassified Rhodococcus (in: high G+C Gram-positive bacteria) TaxID=192944 RepID=UPI00138F40B5|nr:MULTISPECIES: ANTAR domain-containing protein [unclassified Rhodococcus (in: high G+C Gram-positive bacteria)]
MSADTDGEERLSAEARRRRRVLDDSAVIDQAIGVLAELRGVDIATATAMLVVEARRTLVPLSERARAIVASAV